jgi:hypothetical protein
MCHKINIIDFISFRLTTAKKKSGNCLRKGSEAKRWEATDRLKDIGVYIYGKVGREVRGREENNESSKYTPSGQMRDI